MSKLKVLEIRTSESLKSHGTRRGLGKPSARLNILTKAGIAQYPLFSDNKIWSFYVLNQLGYSSFVKPVSENEKFKVKSKMTVKAVKLSDILNLHNIDCNFLTLDVRGYGVNVLLGGSSNIKKDFAGVELFDFVDKQYAYGKNADASANFLEKAGFSKAIEDLYDDANGIAMKRMVYVKDGMGVDLKSILK